jgi:hypothetical protein
MGEVYSGQTSRSPVMPTSYAHQASQLIRGISKRLVLVIIFLCPLFLFSTIDALRIAGLKNILGDQVIDNTIVIFSGCLLVLVVFLVHSLLHSKRILSRWADVFERNSIIAGLNISMNKLTKEEALTAIAESIEEIGQPLRHYFSDSRDLTKFIDVRLGKEIIFDILLDKDITGIPDDLRNVLKEYGAVIIKIENGVVDEDKVTIFSRLLSLYARETKNYVGLPVIMGEDISDSAYSLVNTSHDDVIKRIVLVEMPLVQS